MNNMFHNNNLFRIDINIHISNLFIIENLASSTNYSNDIKDLFHFQNNNQQHPSST